MTLILLIIIAILIYYFFIYRPSAFSKLSVISKKLCPNCHNPVEDRFNVCPICKETLKMKCPNCSERLNISWKYCPYCEESFDRRGEP